MVFQLHTGAMFEGRVRWSGGMALFFLLSLPVAFEFFGTCSELLPGSTRTGQDSRKQNPWSIHREQMFGGDSDHFLRGNTPLELKARTGLSNRGQFLRVRDIGLGVAGVSLATRTHQAFLYQVDLGTETCAAR